MLVDYSASSRVGNTGSRICTRNSIERYRLFENKLRASAKLPLSGTVHERPGEKSCRKPPKLHEGSGRVVLTVQHKAAKVTRKTWRRVVMILLHGAVRVT